MEDLSEDRCKPSPLFSYVGVDTFGPMMVAFRRTRGKSANQKRWGLLFSCLVTRAIKIEIKKQLTNSSFINALWRFVAIHGPVTQFRFDRGTNFVGASDNLTIDAEFIEKGSVLDFFSYSFSYYLKVHSSTCPTHRWSVEKTLGQWSVYWMPCFL